MTWISTQEKMPKYEGDYLCILDAWGHKYPYVCRFGKKLQKIDDLKFRGETGPGFYNYDSEYGYFKRDNVKYWMPIPAFPKPEE